MKKVVSLVLSAALIFSLAVSANAAYTNEIQSIQQTYGVSFEAAKNSIENTIGQIESLRASNQVSDSLLQKLASSLYQLDSATNKSDSKAVDVLLSTVDKSEQSIQGLPDSRGKTAVQVAVDSIREGLGVFTFAASSIKADAPKGVYSDVAESHWAYPTVKRAAELGLMEGVGNGKFDPDTQISVAAFTAICVRAMEKDADARGYGGSNWYDGYMKVAEKYGLIDKGQFTDPNRAMTRAEMSYLAMNVAKYRGESPQSVVPISNIPDLGENGKYMNSIQFSYSLGILLGVDSTGRFDGNGVLTRAAAATVAVRLMGEQRQVPNFTAKPAEKPAPAGAKTWTEGQKHGLPVAGDVVVSKSGQSIVINEKWGILGVGQDVDIWTGLGSCGVGIIGPDGSTLYKAKYTNEVHSVTEWDTIMANSKTGLPKAGTEGQIANDYWEWDSDRGAWNWCGGAKSWSK